MTILWFGLGLCIALFIFFCILSAVDSNVVDVSKELPKPNTPSKPNAPKVKEKPVNISEPVLSFVEVVRKQPRRFITEAEYSHHWADMTGRITFYYSYFLIDKKTGEWWCTDTYSRLKREATDCAHLVRYCENEKRLASDYSWLTEDEMTYLIKEITSIYEARKDRAEKLKTLRKQRRDKQERSRLIKIYVEDV